MKHIIETRLCKEKPILLNNLASAIKNFRQNMTDNFQERFLVTYLDNRNHELITLEVCKGTNTASMLCMKTIFRNATMFNASKIIVAHNHPSNSLSPSGKDIKATSRIKKACELFEIELIDHLILTDEGSFSFYLNRLL